MCKEISIRKFNENDIHNKIKWINDSKNNKYLHYDLPLEYDKTLKWFEKNCDNKNRFDAVIEFNNIPVGFNWFVRYWWKKFESWILYSSRRS